MRGRGTHPRWFIRAYLLRMGTVGVAIALAGGLPLVGCSTGPPSAGTPGAERGGQVSTAKPRVVVLSEAHRTLAERIGGDAITVDLPGPRTRRDPQLPPPREVILVLQGADRILVNGIAQEPWLEKVSLPEEKVVDLGRALKGLPSGEVGIAHRHGPAGALHRHPAATLPWLDLEAAALQAEEMRLAFTALRPDQARSFQQRANDLTDELGELDRAFQDAAARLRGRTFLIVASDLAAFSHRYGLAAVELEERPDGEPALFLQELDRKRGGNGAVLLLTAPLPLPLAAQVQQLGVPTLVLHDGRRSDAAGDFEAQLRANLAVLRNADRRENR